MVHRGRLETLSIGWSLIILVVIYHVMGWRPATNIAYLVCFNKNQALWLIPLVGGATVAVAVGGIVERPCVKDGQIETREHLCLTVTFNHDIVDGAPAARFLKRFSELLMTGELLLDEADVALES